MCFVYILFSKKDKKLYIGCTNSLRRRLGEYERGEVRSTNHRRPLVLVYYEVYNNNSDAERRERFLKGGNGRAQLKIQLGYCFNKIGYKYRQ